MFAPSSFRSIQSLFLSASAVFLWGCFAQVSFALNANRAETTVYVSQNGSCGDANGQSFDSAPYQNLCNSGGSQVSVELNSANQWEWTCNGINGGGNSATCTAENTGSTDPSSGQECRIEQFRVQNASTPGEVPVIEWSTSAGCDQGVLMIDRLRTPRGTFVGCEQANQDLVFGAGKSGQAQVYFMKNGWEAGLQLSTADGNRCTLTEHTSGPVSPVYFYVQALQDGQIIEISPPQEARFQFPPQDGKCGTAVLNTYTQFPNESLLCTLGEAQNMDNSSTDRWTWDCGGSYGGRSAICFAYKQNANASCGSAHQQSFSQQPTQNLCASGELSSDGIQENSTGWNWDCIANNGTSQSCQATQSENPDQQGQCGSANGRTYRNLTEFENVVCHPESTLLQAVEYTQGQGWDWYCQGANEGSTSPLCHADQADPEDAVCGAATGSQHAASPTTGLCTNGTISNEGVQGGNGSDWFWQCDADQEGGTAASCTAPYVECLSNAHCSTKGPQGNGLQCSTSGEQCSLVCSTENQCIIDSGSSCSFVSGQCGSQCTPETVVQDCPAYVCQGAQSCRPTCSSGACSPSSDCEVVIGQCGATNPLQVSIPTQTVVVGQIPTPILLQGGSPEYVISATDDDGTGLAPQIIGNQVRFLGAATGAGKMTISVSDVAGNQASIEIISLARTYVESLQQLYVSSQCHNRTVVSGEYCTLKATGILPNGSQVDLSSLVEWSGYQEVGELEENNTDLKIIPRAIATDSVTTAHITARIQLSETPETWMASEGSSITITIIDPQRVERIFITSKNCDQRPRNIGNVCILNATGIFEDGTEQNITNIVSWRGIGEGSTAFATINTIGEMTLQTAGGFQLSAFLPYVPEQSSEGGVSSENTLSFSVIDPQEMISFTIDSSCNGRNDVVVGDRCPLRAMALFADTTRADISHLVSWEISPSIGNFVEDQAATLEITSRPRSNTRVRIEARLEQEEFDDLLFSGNAIEFTIGELLPQIESIRTSGNFGIERNTTETLYVRVTSERGMELIKDIEVALVEGFFQTPEIIPNTAEFYQIIQADGSVQVDEEGEGPVSVLLQIPIQIPVFADMNDGDFTFWVKIVTPLGDSVEAVAATYLGLRPDFDLNGNGRLEITDIILGLKAVNQEITLTTAQMERIDANRNGLIDMIDLILAFRAYFAQG